jgi:hypothetical protein
LKPALHRIGESESPVVTVDGFLDAPARLVAMAAAMAPLPEHRGNYYPGLRRVLDERDGAAWSAVTGLVAAAAPFIGGGFGCAGFDLLEASFSMVTTAPGMLTPPQRAPHFDSTDPDYLALLLYLSDTAGTAFYRQRSTGIEVVAEANLARFVDTARRESAAMRGYTAGPNAWFDRIGMVEGLAGRLVIYRGNLLHSGIIPPDADFSSDPRRGRLTLNLFVQGN